MSALPGRIGIWDHVCHLCQGKKAKQLARTLVKRQKRREERAWRKDQGA